MNRFAKRRELLRLRHVCTRCGTEAAKPGCRLCPTCLSVLAAKRAVTADPATRERRERRARRQRQLLEQAMAQIDRRFLAAL